MTEIDKSTLATTLTLRVAEARVEDIGHAMARLAPSDLARLGARAGDVLKISGGTIGVGRAGLSDPGFEGMIGIDGTCRSNCSAGLQEQVTVSLIEHEQAVAVRLSPLWVGAPPATIAPDRMLEDLVGVPVMAGSVVRVSTFAKAVNFQVVRTIPSGAVVIGKRTDLRVVEGEKTGARAPAVSYEDELPLKYPRKFLPSRSVLRSRRFQHSWKKWNNWDVPKRWSVWWCRLVTRSIPTAAVFT
jgi:Cell division protein 48 (CDC48), N-terminal domain